MNLSAPCHDMHAESSSRSMQVILNLAFVLPFFLLHGPFRLWGRRFPIRVNILNLSMSSKSRNKKKNIYENFFPVSSTFQCDHESTWQV